MNRNKILKAKMTNEDLLELYNIYSNQVMEYDKTSVVTSVGILGFIGTIILVSGNIFAYIVKSEIQSGFQARGYIFLIVLLEFIPLGISIYLYIFSMSCRKVSMCRAYLTFLEDVLNIRMGLNIMAYNRLVDGIFMDKFIVNMTGPIAMSIFFTLVYGGTISFIYDFYAKAVSIVGLNNNLVIFIKYTSIIFIALNLLYNLLCIRSLCKNTAAANDIYIALCTTITSKNHISDCKGVKVNKY